MKFLDYTGLQTFWLKIKTWVSSAVTTNTPSTSKTVTGWESGKITYGNISITKTQVQGTAANTTLVDDLALKADLASPALTGTPTAPTAATGTDTTQIATTAFVNAEIDHKMSLADAMIYKGAIEGGSSGTYGSLTPAADKGWTYKVSVAGKIDGQDVRVGDILICNTDSTPAATASNYTTVWDNWDYYPANEDGVVIGPSSAVDSNVALFDGATGKLIKDSGKTLGKSVPADAVFTDTKVTSVGNHYAPAEDSTAQLDADASGATAAWSLDVVTGVTIKRDAKGHVTGVAVDSGKIPANPNVDTKVTQNSNSEDKEFPLLAKYSNNSTNETQTAKYAAAVTVNPNKGQITATKFKGALEGNADSASAAASGSALETAIGAKADKVSGATNGNFAGLDASGNLTDSGKSASDFATASHTHGNITNAGGITATGVTIADGDALVVVDSSDTDKKVAKTSITFDGSTATKALTQKGTWETFNNYTHPAYTANAAAAVKVGNDATGHVVLGDALVKGDVGLGNVDNTADADKQVLDATKLHTARNIDGVSFDGSGMIHHFGVCNALASAQSKAATLDDSMSFTLARGASVFVKFGNSNTASNPTLNVNGTGAKNIYLYGYQPVGVTAKTSWKSGSVVHLVYDGSAWQTVGWLNDDTTYTNASLGQGYGTCSTAEATAAKAVTLSDYSLTTGGMVAVKFTYGLCASATMNVNSTGAKNIYIHGAAVTATTAKEVLAGDIAYFMYDGTQYQFLGCDRVFKAAIVSFADAGTAGTDATVQYTKADGSTGTLMTAITTAEIEALS